MAKEATLWMEYEPAIPFTCSDSTGIEKGTAVTLSDPMTVAACTDSTTAFGGITKVEKVASDGNTKVAIYRRGIFVVYCSGAVTVGQAVVFQDNYAMIQGATNTHRAGIALETAADGESFLIELNPAHRILA